MQWRTYVFAMGHVKSNGRKELELRVFLEPDDSYHDINGLVLDEKAYRQAFTISL